MPAINGKRAIAEERREELRVVQELSNGARYLRAEDAIRAAAVEADRSLRGRRPAAANAGLHLWEELLSGHWTLVDWFDADGRRFIVAKQRPPQSAHRRGLTPRERVVANYAARGESGKRIAFQIGLSPSRTSVLLKTVMRKLGVRTRVQLVLLAKTLCNRIETSAPRAPVSEATLWPFIARDSSRPPEGDT